MAVAGGVTVAVAVALILTLGDAVCGGLAVAVSVVVAVGGGVMVAEGDGEADIVATEGEALPLEERDGVAVVVGLTVGEPLGL